MPEHNVVLALVTVGIPILALAAWARPGPRRIAPSPGSRAGVPAPAAEEEPGYPSSDIHLRGSGPGGRNQRILRATSPCAFPAASAVTAVALAIYLAYLTLTGDVEIARTALISVTVLCGVLLIPFVEPPTPAWVAGDELSGDWRPWLQVAGMLGLFGLIMAVAPLRSFFELVPLCILDYAVLGAIAAAWAVVLRLIWRARLFERLLDPS